LIFFPGSAASWWARTLVYAMAAVTVFSGADYVFRARREVFGSQGAGGGDAGGGSQEERAETVVR